MSNPASPRLGSVPECLDELSLHFAMNMSPQDCCAVVQKHVAHWRVELGADAAAARAGEVYDAMGRDIAETMRYLDERRTEQGSPAADFWIEAYAPRLVSVNAARDAAARAAGYQSLLDFP